MGGGPCVDTDLTSIPIMLKETDERTKVDWAVFNTGPSPLARSLFPLQSLVNDERTRVDWAVFNTGSSPLARSSFPLQSPDRDEEEVFLSRILFRHFVNLELVDIL